MNLKELQKREVELLSSNRSTLMEYGKAYKDILKMCQLSSDPWLSDDVLISDKAIEFIQKTQEELKIKNDENLKLQIYAANKLIIKTFIQKEKIANLLEKYKYTLKNFDEAREILKFDPNYRKMHPKTLSLVLNDLGIS